MNRNLHTIVVGSLNFPPYDSLFEQSQRVYSPRGLAPAIHTMGGGNQEIKILIEL